MGQAGYAVGGLMRDLEEVYGEGTWTGVLA